METSKANLSYLSRQHNRFIDMKRLITRACTAVILGALIGTVTSYGQSQTDQQFICLQDEDNENDRSTRAPLGDEIRALVVFVAFSDDTTTQHSWPLYPDSLWTPPAFIDNLLDTSDNPQTYRPGTLSGILYNQSRHWSNTHLLYGDVYPKNIHEQSVVYVPNHANGHYHGELVPGVGRVGGYGLLVKEILDSLTGDGLDLGLYVNNQDGLVDQIILVVRSDNTHCTGGACGVASLHGTTTGTGVTAGYPLDQDGSLMHDLYYDSALLDTDVRVDLRSWGSGQINWTPTMSMGLIMHEYGHHLFDPVQSGHTTVIGGLDVPLNDQGGDARINYTVMDGDADGTNSAGAFAAQERRYRGWLSSADLTSSGTYVLPEFYDTGQAYDLDMPNSPTGSNRTLTLVNRQPNFSSGLQFLLNTTRGGLYFEMTQSSSMGEHRSYRLLPADNNLFTWALSPPSVRAGNAFSPTGPRAKIQLTPWTRPNINGFNEYPGNITPFWHAIDNIRYTGSADSTMAFDYHADFRTLSTVPIRADSWMGAETSGTVFTGEVVVKSGVTLTLWQGTEIEFAGGLKVEPGGSLVIEEDVLVTIGSGAELGGLQARVEIAPGAQIRFGEDAVLNSNQLTAVGTSAAPIIFERDNQSLAWSGIHLRGGLVGGAEPWPHRLEHVRIEGATVGLDLRTAGARLSHAEVLGSGQGIATDYYIDCTGGWCEPSMPSRASLHQVLVDGSDGHGLMLRNAQVALWQSTIAGSGGDGVYVQNTVMTRFSDNVIDGPRTSGSTVQQPAGLRVSTNADVQAGGTYAQMAGKNRFIGDDRLIVYGMGGYLVLGTENEPNGSTGHFNTIIGEARCWIHNNSGTTLTAELNYWGDAAGPPVDAFCGTSPVAYEPHHIRDETGGSGAHFKALPLAHGGLSEGETLRGGSSATEVLGEQIRQVRGWLLENAAKPGAAARVQELAGLHRRDMEDETGEWSASHQALTDLREQLLSNDAATLPAPLRRTAERAAIVLVHHALATENYDDADTLLGFYDGIVEGPFEEGLLALTAINVDEAFLRYDEALGRIDALLAGPAAEDEDLLAELEQLVALITAKAGDGEVGGRPAPIAPPAAERPISSSPDAFALGAAFPNPTSGATTLPLALPEGAEVHVSAYDLLGRPVAVLAEQRFEAGRFEVTLDGAGLSAGVYVVRAEMVTAGSERHVFTQRVTVVR
jgi:hypothetical protein